MNFENFFLKCETKLRKNTKKVSHFVTIHSLYLILSMKQDYIYVNYRENGIALAKYVGECTDEIYNLALNNSIKTKE